VPPTSEYEQNENESVPRSSKEQICATPNHHHDTSTLQNDKKNATKKSPHVLYTVCAGRKNRMLLQEPYWAEMHRLGQIDQVHYGIIPSTIVSRGKIYNIYDTSNANIHL
jgi:hypothetical protein